MPRKNSYKPSEHVSKVILAATRAAPGIRSDALAKETALHETTVSTAGRVLIGKGLLRREKKGRHFHYYPAGAEDAREPQQLFLSSEPLLEAEIETLEAEIETLKAEIEELRAFKKHALTLYPGLGVEPILHRARQIAQTVLFKMGERDAADAVMFGDADNTPIVQSTLAALRAAAVQKED